MVYGMKVQEPSLKGSEPKKSKPSEIGREVQAIGQFAYGDRVLQGFRRSASG